MLQKLLNFLKEPTSKNIIINTIGNYLNVFFTAIFALILVRILSPEEYGVLSVLLGISYVMANMLEFGTTATIYSQVPPLYTEDDPRLFQFIKSTFFFQTLFALLVIVGFTLSLPWLDVVFFKTGASAGLLYITGISMLFFIWQNFCMNIFFATNQFMRANIYLNISNAVKMLILMYLAWVDMVSLNAVILTFGFVGPFVFFAGVLSSKFNKFVATIQAPVKRKEFRFGYTLTYFAASQFYNLGLRMDLFLLSFFGLGAAVGHYGLAQKIILSIITSIVSITQVLSPGFSTIKDSVELKKQMKKGFLYMLIPTGVFVALFFTPKSIFQIVFTKDFGQAAEISHALALPFILNALGTIPMLFILYTVKKPVYILISNIVFFAIITGGSYLLIPRFGVFGPPYAITAAFIGAVGIHVWAAVREHRRKFL